ncbi:MAG TPA: tRNA uridine-5-carboxymethylaminomethyl(34) synthesis enzyme MnmG, partial [Anaerolineae bacterium]|nr:tRNA uridine-5-carboxymethylaminomethyl(34) synthesis enzyme MnmG [Anaerolineae bacterium]
LSKYGYELGLLSEDHYSRVREKETVIAGLVERLESTLVPPSDVVNDLLVKIGTSPIQRHVSLIELIRRPEVSINHVYYFLPELSNVPAALRQQVEVEVKYEGYIKRQHSQIRQFKRLEAKKIPAGVDFMQLNGISIQAREKLSRVRPQSIGQASRISGVSPADINALLIYIELYSG